MASEVLGRAGVPHRVWRNPRNLGYADNFLEAAAQATSPYIAFSDQDDVWHPRKLELSVVALLADGACLAVHPLRVVDTAGRVTHDMTQGITRRGVLPALQRDPFGVYFGLSMTFDARLLTLLPAERRGVDTYSFDAPLSHDRWVYFLATNFGRTSLLPEPLVDYRQHGTQSFGALHVGLRQRFLNKVSEGAPRLRAQGEAASATAHLVDEHTPGYGASLHEAAGWRAVADRYHRIARLYDQRARLYESPAFGSRLSSVVGLARTGAYCGLRHGGLGAKRVLEDLSVGLLRLGAR